MQEKKELLPTLHQHLQRIDLVTADKQLQQQFLIASHGMLCPVYASAKPEVFQVLPRSPTSSQSHAAVFACIHLWNVSVHSFQTYAGQA